MDHDMTADLAAAEDVRPQESGAYEVDASAYDGDYTSEITGESDAEERSLLSDVDDEEAAEQVEYEGNLYQVPRQLKDALLRQADYTRKTMELADQRRSLAAHKAEIEQVQALTVEEFHAASRLEEIDRELDELSQYDWSAVDLNHPDMAELRAVVGDLAQEQAALHGILNEHHNIKSAREQQEIARTRAETDHVMAREIQDWSPEKRHALESFAVALGIPDDLLGHASAAEMRILNLAFLGAQQVERQRAANRGAIRPAAEIGTNAGSGPSDPSRMSMAQYRAWRAKQK